MLSLASLSGARIGLLGDLCLDAYWIADMRNSELSRETPHFPLPIVAERYSPGAGGNVASNLKALNLGALRVIGLVGEDWRGALLLHELAERGIPTGDIVRTPARITCAYCKPMRRGFSSVEYEDPRIDFAVTDPLAPDVEDAVIESLARVAGEIDVLCVSDQFKYGVVTDRVREYVCSLAAAGLRVVVDSRDRIALYRDCILKPNLQEAQRALSLPVCDECEVSAEQALLLADRLLDAGQCAALITLGAGGCVYADADTRFHIPAFPVDPPIDFCGAGDTYLSMFAAAIAAKFPAPVACRLAHAASGVTIKKIGQTGTASREEIVALWESQTDDAQQGGSACP